MSKTFDFYFDLGSGASYLAWRRLADLEAQTGARAVQKPMLLGGVFKATGNASPMAVPAKGVYVGRDLARFAARHAIALQTNPHFPINTLVLMRAVTALLDTDHYAPFVTHAFNAIWRDARNLNDPAEAAAMIKGAGLDPVALLAEADTPAVKDRLKATTQEAIDRGVFGAPTFFVGDEMWFGQDRMDWVAEALKR